MITFTPWRAAWWRRMIGSPPLLEHPPVAVSMPRGQRTYTTTRTYISHAHRRRMKQRSKAHNISFDELTSWCDQETGVELAEGRVG
jgi:hypothetical protein